jgi:hypothetical protein
MRCLGSSYWTDNGLKEALSVKTRAAFAMRKSRLPPVISDVASAALFKEL